MTTSALCNRVVAVTWMDYTEGRYGVTPRLVVLHDMEAPDLPGVAWNIGQYFNRGSGSSAHYGVDSWETVGYLGEEHMAWAAPGANTDGIHIEMTGYARWTRAEWLEHQAMIARAGLLAADIARRNGIPPVLLSNADLAAGRWGIVHHLQVSEVYQRSDHWDTGYAFPFDVFMAHTSGASPTPGPTPTRSKREMSYFVPQPGEPFGWNEGGISYPGGAIALRHGACQRGDIVDVWLTAPGPSVNINVQRAGGSQVPAVELKWGSVYSYTVENPGFTTVLAAAAAQGRIAAHLRPQ